MLNGHAEQRPQKSLSTNIIPVTILRHIGIVRQSRRARRTMLMMMMMMISDSSRHDDNDGDDSSSGDRHCRSSSAQREITANPTSSAANAKDADDAS